MKKAIKRPAAVLLAFLMIVCTLPFAAFGEFENTYRNTGNGRLDIIGVAKTQVGNRDGTKYTAGRGNIAWCACFVVWCARQAGINEDILKDNTWADAEDFGVRYYSKEVYTPQSGDLIFFDFEPKNPNTPMSAYGDHVGIVEAVEGETVKTVEGNAWSSVNRAYQVIESSYPLSSPKIKGYGLVEYNKKDGLPVSFGADFTVSSETPKIARAGAGEAFEQTRELPAESTVSVVGFVYDENSMLWYKTAQGDYTVGTDLKRAENGIFPPADYLDCTAKTLSAKTVYRYPNGDSDSLKKIRKNKTVEISGYLYNEYGNVWYRLKSGGYIYCSDLLFEQAGTPTNSLTETFTVRANEKILRADPRLSAGRTRTLWRSAEVSVKGYVYDREAKLWYLTENGDYIYCSYLTPKGESDLSKFEDRPFVLKAEKSAKSAPSSASKTICTLERGKKVRACTNVKGFFGELWYETTDGVFLSADNLSCDHDYDGGVITKKATCIEKGVMTYTCKYCGRTKTKAIKINPANHSALKTENAVAVTCNRSGFSGDVYCTGCKALVSKGVVLPSLEHCDGNHDMVCDNCGAAFSTPEDCRCACHRFGLTKVVYKIVRVFWKILKIHRVCICGEEHY